MAFFGVNGHPAVVAHMLVAAGSHVEKRGLPAVRVSDQGYPDGAGFIGIVIFLRRDLD